MVIVYGEHNPLECYRVLHARCKSGLKFSYQLHREFQILK